MENQSFSTKSLFMMSWPIFVELMLQMLVGNMDQIMLSHYNDTAVAAVGNANQFIVVIILMFSITSLAATIMISQYKGAQDESSVQKIYTLAVMLNLLISSVLCVTVIIFAEPIFTMLRLPAELMPEAISYLVITAVSLPFNALMMSFSSFLRASARMKHIMTITGVINILNVIGNAALINGLWGMPRMGAAGAALSTTLCRAVGLVLMAWCFFRSVQGARVSLKLLRPFPTSLLKRMVGIGLPAGGESLSYNLSQMSCLVFINIMGTAAVTTRAYAIIIAQVCYMLVSALSQAGQILVGYRIGAGDYDGADTCTRKVITLGMPVTIGITILLWIFSDPVYSLFTSDLSIIELGSRILFVEIFLEIGRCLNIVLVRNLQAAGDIRFPVLVGIGSQWIVAVGLGWALGVALGWGLVGIWVAFAADEILRGIIFVIRWRSGHWRTIKTVRI